MDAANRQRLEQLVAGSGTGLDELYEILEQVAEASGADLNEILKGLEQAVETKTSPMGLPTNRQLRK